jgi:hypothetical protein
MINYGKPWDMVFFRIDGVLYTWSGWFGCQLISYERKRPNLVEPRIIAGNKMYVYDICRKGLFKFKVKWTLCNTDNCKIRKLKKDLAGLV